jgi:uncharacterized membrane protein
MADMTMILLLAVVLLGIVLANTRSRLERLEREVRDGLAPPQPEAVEPRRSAIIVDRPVEPAAALLAEAAPSVETTPLAPAALPPAPEPWPVMPEEEAALPAAPDRTGSGFEDLFGRKLPIWAGGITLLVAAVLLVKYSIDAGLLAPWVRVTLGLVFGAGLIAAAELARNMERFVQDERVAQSLAGAGIGSLYAATLAAHNLYGLIGPGTAFAGLTITTALALGLALRFGAPCAVLGLIGGLAAPAMVQSVSPNVPVLSVYLALVVGGIAAVSRRERWFWLGVGALLGGAGWTALLIVMGELDRLSTLSVGLLVLMLGIALPMVSAADRRGPVLRVVTAIIAALQLALLVATGGYTMLNWGLYGLLSLAFVWLTSRMPTLRAAALVPMLTGLALAALWPEPHATLFTIVLTGLVLIFGGSALWRLWKPEGGLLETAQLVLLALGGFAVTYRHYGAAPLGEDTASALLALAFAALPIAGAALGWTKTDRRADLRFPLLVLAAGLLVVIAAMLGLPVWTIPVSIAAVTGALLWIGAVAEDQYISRGALAYLGGAIIVLLQSAAFNGELLRLGQTEMLEHPAQALLRWAAVLAASATAAWRIPSPRIRRALTGIATVAAYGLVAQALPAPWLAIAAALGLLAAAEAMRRAPKAGLEPVPGVLAVIGLLWALQPLAYWAVPGLTSLAGQPVLLTDPDMPAIAAQRLLAPALIGLVALWRMRALLPALARTIAAVEGGLLALIGTHILYKQLFAIGDMQAFIRLGLAERTLWELALIGAGFAAWRFVPDRRMPLALIASGLAHNLLYSLLLHNPLWAEQAVGAWPLVNLLLPAFAIGFAGPALIGRLRPDWLPALQLPATLLRMAVILLFAYASLRQLFAGSLLAGTPIGATENIGWSVLAIGLAIGFLLWGIRRGEPAWRIGSLLLMLVAVGKVFLLDASGLEGLLRIVSFLALGFSLIGIGWLYSRYLRPDPVNL